MEWPFAEEVFDTPDLPLENGKKRKSSDVSEMSPLGHPGWVLDPYMVEGEEQTEQASQRNRVQAHAPPSLSVARISDYHVFSPSRTNPAYSLWSLSTFGLLACNDEFAAVTGGKLRFPCIACILAINLYQKPRFHRCPLILYGRIISL